MNFDWQEKKKQVFTYTAVWQSKCGKNLFHSQQHSGNLHWLLNHCTKQKSVLSLLPKERKLLQGNGCSNRITYKIHYMHGSTITRYPITHRLLSLFSHIFLLLQQGKNTSLPMSSSLLVTAQWQAARDNSNRKYISLHICQASSIQLCNEVGVLKTTPPKAS